MAHWWLTDGSLMAQLSHDGPLSGLRRGRHPLYNTAIWLAGLRHSGGLSGKHSAREITFLQMILLCWSAEDSWILLRTSGFYLLCWTAENTWILSTLLICWEHLDLSTLLICWEHLDLSTLLICWDNLNWILLKWKDKLRSGNVCVFVYFLLSSISMVIGQCPVLLHT